MLHLAPVQRRGYALALLAGSSDNCVAGNTTGVDNTAGVIADLTNNWWGSASGPSGAAVGTGDSVSLPAVEDRIAAKFRCMAHSPA